MDLIWLNKEKLVDPKSGEQSGYLGLMILVLIGSTMDRLYKIYMHMGKGAPWESIFINVTETQISFFQDLFLVEVAPTTVLMNRSSYHVLFIMCLTLSTYAYLI